MVLVGLAKFDVYLNRISEALGNRHRNLVNVKLVLVRQ
ncbi:hypothetical protein J2S05_002144 [Alkalicoccobacillus murimartini]|uniref:Uncharacterized protein n=1 Tax=Alkalicoccobacillus murimartini TaxID=171685 RepID=A0ABT9YIN0_9BACI|nr:hypothetical protein [Alkalicoccobacillus murimartini]